MKEFELKIESIFLCKKKDLRKIQEEAMDAVRDIIYKYNKNVGCISTTSIEVVKVKEDLE